MMEAVLIRRAEAKDAEEIQSIAADFATSFRVEAGAFQRSFDELLATPYALLAVAEVDGQAVGYALGFVHSTLYANGKVAWVEEIAVQPAFRNRGIGRRLMHCLEQWAGEQECKLIALATRRASAFYERLGYASSADYFRKLL